jgi:hypothetical protein
MNKNSSQGTLYQASIAEGKMHFRVFLKDLKMKNHHQNPLRSHNPRRVVV